jgi:hypothetical protein
MAKGWESREGADPGGGPRSGWSPATTLERQTDRKYNFLYYYRLALKIMPEIEAASGLNWQLPKFQEVDEWTQSFDRTHTEFRAYDYLAHSRHNGFPSPLLDWSGSPYVAAYFAFSKATSDPVAIYGLRGDTP